MARTVDPLGGGLELLFALALVRDAGGELLGALLLCALAQDPDALKTKLKRTCAHEGSHRRRSPDLKRPACGARDTPL